MIKAKKSIVQFLNSCYNYVQDKYSEIFEREQYFIVSPRGTYAFIVLIGSINTFLSKEELVNHRTTAKERFSEIEKYLQALLEYLKLISKEEEEKQFTFIGTGGDLRWLRFFQTIVNDAYPEYYPLELVDWKERQDERLQDEGRKYGVAIEKQMKRIVLQKIQYLYKENWELEINSITRECSKRAEEENEKNYKEGLNKKNVQWTEMFNINDYKTIIDKYWTSVPNNSLEKVGFKPFQDEFSIDVGAGFHSKSEKIKWISYFNSYRNLWAHEGTKEKRLNKDEVGFLKKVHEHFNK